MKRTLSILALLTVALSVAWTDPAPSVLAADELSVCEPVGVGWTCSFLTECNTQIACVEPPGPVSATYCRCCPPPCQSQPCEIQECTRKLVSLSCGC